MAYKGDDTCEMVVNLPIGPGQEVFNSYEKGLTNAELLCQYGFILDVNENNVVSWSVDELLHDITEPEKTRSLWEELVSLWPRNLGWDDVQLVFNPSWDDDDDDGVPTLKRANSSFLHLNADGQISHQLWLFLFTLVRSDVDIGDTEVLQTAHKVARTQEEVEALTSEAVRLIPGPFTSESQRPYLHLLRLIARKVIQICDVKIASFHHSRLAASEIGELLDVSWVPYFGDAGWS